MPLLHGVLHVVVHEASDLAVTRRIQAVGCLKRYVCCGMLPELSGSCDPYLCLDVGNTRRLRTRFIVGTHHPQWHEEHEVYVADEADVIKVEVKDADVVGADFLGEATIPVAEIIGGQPWDKWLHLTDSGGRPLTRRDARGDSAPSRVHLSIHYKPVGQEDPAGNKGEVPRTYFPLRPGNRVTLYHDAVCQPGPVPGITLAGGGLYNESSCWDDLHSAIQQAQSFIWITGWSVWTDTLLQRQPASPHNSLSLGELLVQKAEQGVTVLMLVWDDTSNNSGLIAGVMATHDQKTLKYFKHTAVTCILCPRQGGMEDSLLQKAARANLFTHHQKTVVVDCPIPPGTAVSDTGYGMRPTKRLLAFIGGIDLTSGRYDYPSHPLFDSCQHGGSHADDMHQACVEGMDPSKPCPREPWHDIHARVEGPAAVDVAINFMERWVKQAGKLHFHRLFSMPHKETILLPQALRDFRSKRSKVKGQLQGHVALRLETIKAQDPGLELKGLPPGEDWNVQLFRTIDSDSAEGFPTHAQGSYEAGLTVGKGKSVDASVHRAYIHLIRRSKRFLYLETQYFLGSAHLWDSDTETPCTHLVPAEIALKIVSKIRAGEPYRVYIVTPLFPEGIPTSGSVQAILYFQAKTRQMMYRRIAAAIDEAGLKGKAHPQDYLQFFCLGKREAPGTTCTVPQLPDTNGTANGHPAITASLADFARPEDGRRQHITSSDAAAAHRGAAAASPAEAGTPRSTREVELAGVDKGPSGAPVSADDVNPSTAQGRATAARRFMIYVHSKMMIVDDEYVVVGSANINQRSLDGTRDSEICIGAFQSGHIMASASSALPCGQVAGFRKALWLEHLGDLPAEVEDPSSEQCMRTLSRLGAENWAAYIGPDTQPLPYGHLLVYPSWVDGEGVVGPLPDCEEFPDLKGKIMGTKSMVLPGILTT